MGALEEFKDIPFKVKRVYYMYDTTEGVTRGRHTHKNPGALGDAGAVVTGSKIQYVIDCINKF